MTDTMSLALCIPAYNAAWCLPRLLQSAHAQTVAFDEIWVYDDCSTDDTVAVAERLGARVVRGDVNRGCSHGKNRLAGETGADWIHFHDADDALLPRFVELARRWMAADAVDVVLFPYEERDEATGARMGHRWFDADDVRADARSYAIREQINPFCGLYRRQRFLDAGGYDEDPQVLYNEDVAAHVRLAFAGLRFDAESEVAIVNHRRLDSMSAANRLKCLQAQYHVMRKTAERPDGLNYGTEIAQRLWLITGGLTAELDWDTADAAAALALRLGHLDQVELGAVFRTLCRLSPALALRLREGMIRTFKPRCRTNQPGWRAPFNLL